MTITHRLFAVATLASLVAGSAAVFAQELEEIVVTARYRSESLQEIPISVTAFDSVKIEAAGITDIEGFINLTPNFMAREGFRSGVTFLTIRGITTGQKGFAPISYIIDGVKTSYMDAVNQGTLFDLERIEVLKGPQSALYGAGAIAGAVNVITKEPTDELEGQVKLGYAEGNDFTFKGAVSGPISEALRYRVSAYYRDTDGLVNTATGDDLDFEEQVAFRGRLLFTPNDALSVEFRAAYSEIDVGAAKQENFREPGLLNAFNSSIKAERGIIGEENRDILDLSAKIDFDLGVATLTSVTSWHEMDQFLYGSASWKRPPALGEPAPVIGLFGPIFGANAVEPAMGFGPMGPTGQAIDHFQQLVDDIEIFTQDVRLTSQSEDRFRWVVGFEYIDREIIDGLTLGTVNPQNTSLNFVNQFDERRDEIWGVYAHLSFDVTDDLELTVSGRYDEDDYSTGMFNPVTGATINSLDDSGNPVERLKVKNSKFQPKVTLSYDWSDNLHAYVTYSEGYRFGFFSTGNLTQPEETKNYELGFKSELFEGRATFNAAVFYIEYSNQQLTRAIASPPFRVTTNIPESDVLGFELEGSLRVTENLGLSAGVGYLDTEIDELKRRLDAVPKVTVNVAVDYTQPIGNDMEVFGRFDWRHQGEFLLNTPGGPYEIHAVDLLNLRIGVNRGPVSITGFFKNMLDERFATNAAFFGPAGFIRSYNLPSQFGVEAGYRF